MTTLDAYIQHQVYVEGFKNGQAEDADTLFEELIAAIIIVLSRRAITNVGELSRTAANAVIREVKAKVAELYNKQVELTFADIKRFMNIDLDVMGRLTKKASDMAVAVNAMNRDKLWDGIIADPIAGEGIEPKAAFPAQLAAMQAGLTVAIKRAWADNVPLADLIRELVGTVALKRKDGFFWKQRSRLSTLIQTTIQHVTTELQFRLGALTSTHYVWCSILDSRTTEICRSRNGKAYEYGAGPRPPAHWNCRSFTIPATIVKSADMPTWYTWVKTQPAGLQDDILGSERGRDLRTGKLKSDDLPGFDKTRPLTLQQYADKVNKILNEVA